MSDMQRRAQRTDEDDKPRTMPGPERVERLGNFKAKYPDIDIDEKLEPSEGLWTST